MNIKTYGWNKHFQKKIKALNTKHTPARIIGHYQNYYEIITDQGKLLAELSGKFLYDNPLKSQLPTVGDWVLADILPEESKAIIHNLIPRKTCFSRKTAGKDEEQVVAANIDVLSIVTALDQDFSVNRIERYITLALESGASALVILNKLDILNSVSQIKKDIKAANLGAKVIFTSSKTNQGIDKVKKFFKSGTTTAFVGSSGVGKSSIINSLFGKEVLKTGEIREKDGKGRHVTTSKEMLITPADVIVIDTPGIREIALWCTQESLDDAFDDIAELSANCKFSNCAHETEPGCAVKKAQEEGTLSEKRLENYQKMKKEIAYIERKADKIASSNVKKRWKNISTLAKKIKKF